MRAPSPFFGQSRPQPGLEPSGRRLRAQRAKRLLQLTPHLKLPITMGALSQMAGDQPHLHSADCAVQISGELCLNSRAGLYRSSTGRLPGGFFRVVPAPSHIVIRLRS